MTSKATTLTQERGEQERFPEYPPRDDMQNWLHLYETAVVTTLSIHYAGEPNVTVASEVPVGPSLPVRADARIPDLMVVRDGDRALMEEQRGYAIDRQGKAPDFVLEVASPTTGRADYTDKRRDYERFGVTEYWRFDPSGGEFHDAALAGDRLVDGVYEPIVIETLDDDRLRGYSDVLGLYVCWEAGMLRFFDPGTESYLDTHEEERAGRLAAQTPPRLALRKSGPVARRQSRVLRSLRPNFDACATNRQLPSSVHSLSDTFPRPKIPPSLMQQFTMFPCTHFLRHSANVVRCIQQLGGLPLRTRKTWFLPSCIFFTRQRWTIEKGAIRRVSVEVRPQVLPRAPWQ